MFQAKRFRTVLLSAQRGFVFLCAFYAFACTTNKAPEHFSIAPLNETGLSSLLAHAKGSVVLINCWASWCDPCKKEFPDLLKLRENYHDKGLEVIFISTDDTDRVEAYVKPFLLHHNVSFPMYVKNVHSDEDFINFLNKEWSGALPATFLYDRSGKQVQWWLGEEEYSFFEKAIQPLL